MYIGNTGGFYMATTSCNDENYLFDDKKYRGDEISNLSDRRLLKATIELVDKVDFIKEDFEFDLLDNEKEVNKYKSLFKTKKNFMKELIEKNSMEWLKELPLYKALVNEIEKRNLTYYLTALLERRDK